MFGIEIRTQLRRRRNCKMNSICCGMSATSRAPNPNTHRPRSVLPKKDGTATNRVLAAAERSSNTVAARPRQLHNGPIQRTRARLWFSTGHRSREFRWNRVFCMTCKCGRPPVRISRRQVGKTNVASPGGPAGVMTCQEHRPGSGEPNKGFPRRDAVDYRGS